jgi:hypothetical protein
MCLDIIKSLIVEGLKFLIVLFIICLGGAVFYFSTRSKLYKFFGISKKNDSLKIFVSSLIIKQGGAVDSLGTPRRYSGVALPDGEFRSSYKIFEIFELKDLERLIAKITKNYVFYPVNMKVMPSPNNQKDIYSGNAISLGSPGYNEATKYYLNLKDAYLNFTPNNDGFMIKKGRDKGKIINNVDKKDLAIIQKIKTHGSVVFITAGLGVNGTRGSFE